MKNLTSNQIRRLFLDFFKEKNHQEYPSKSLVPVNDPTLLWINSGVATLKKYFDGREVPENPRMANSQKCIRTNDIDNVGVTARHHTFFEMLGNFSIGDYFKQEAILWAWEFLTSEKWLGLDKAKLYVTVYPTDEEAFRIWNKEVGLPETHIVRFEKNFWEIGEGPSGPNTEIFYDRGREYEFDTPKEEMFPGGENERYLEIWNLVFSQYNADPNIPREEYKELPNKNIDTGMGLERLVSVIQNAPTNYETDLFMPIIQAVEAISGYKYLDNVDQTIAFRVIADHLRAATFAISDGALPSNEGRGYIIRRLIRRAIKFARKLGINKPFMKDFVGVVAEIMKDYYPEINEKKDFISRIIVSEEQRFFNTLNDGLNILNEVIKNSKDKTIDGKTAFKLYDTFGFPIELTEEYAYEAGLTVDIEGFNKELEAQRERARSAREEVDSMQSQNEALMNLKVDSKFVGYNTLITTSKVIAIIKDGVLVNETSESAQIITSETPFYAESGGQAADTGKIHNDEFEATVVDVQRAPNGQHLHTIKTLRGSIKINSELNLSVDNSHRDEITKNHTATHLLHKALKIVLGEHVNQAGAYKTYEKLRFDFTHMSALTDEEISKVEEIVNENIWRGIKLTIEEMPIDKAKAMGATALFGEKYGNVVRVVQAGDFSIELCGGTHVKDTSSIGLFKILSESGIGAGVRRIEAVTSKNAYRYMQEYQNKVSNICSIVKAKEKEVIMRVNSLVEDNKELLRNNESLSAKLSSMKSKDLINSIEEINGFSILRANIPNTNMNNLRNMVDDFKNKLKSAIIVLASPIDDKVSIVVGVTDDYIKRGAHAGKIIKEVASICNGGGGGRPDMAQAGGKSPEKVNEAIKHVENIVKSL